MSFAHSEEFCAGLFQGAIAAVNALVPHSHVEPGEYAVQRLAKLAVAAGPEKTFQAIAALVDPENRGVRIFAALDVLDEKNLTAGTLSR